MTRPKNLAPRKADPTSALRTAVRFATRDLPPSTERVDGITLALYRVASGVTAVAVAGALDASKQYIAALERDGTTVETAGRYRAAVDLLSGGA